VATPKRTASRATEVSRAKRLSSGWDCLLAQAPILLSRGQEEKYAFASAAETGETALLESLAREARERLSRPESEMPEIAAWREAFSRMGLKPTQYRCAAEALLRRFRKERSLPSLHPLVDYMNYLSLSAAIPIAVFDRDKIAGGITVRPAHAMNDVLAQIIAHKREEIARLQDTWTEAALLDAASIASAPRGFGAALRRATEAGGYALIGEIKKRSPSKGLIRPDFDPADLARAYEEGGATCISVLTDGPSFEGALADIGAARNACALPSLRKDFMLDPLQVLEARAAGADAILVILAAIDDATARDLLAAAAETGMDVIVEVHEEAELERAMALPAQIIGINNRSLKTRLPLFKSPAPTRGREVRRGDGRRGDRCEDRRGDRRCHVKAPCPSHNVQGDLRSTAVGSLRNAFRSALAGCLIFQLTRRSESGRALCNCRAAPEDLTLCGRYLDCACGSLAHDIFAPAGVG
jgi:indole-3-glycerol phosphate synthase